MKRTILVVALAVSAPAAAQEARVYTNADLVQGRPVTRTRTVTPDELRGLEERQFKFQPPLPDGPQVVAVWSSPTAGPFGEFPHYHSRRLEGLPLYGYGYSWGVTPYRPYVSSGRIATPGRRDNRGTSRVNGPRGRR